MPRRQGDFGTTREPAAAYLCRRSVAEHRRGDRILRLAAAAQRVDVPDTDEVLAPHTLAHRRNRHSDDAGAWRCQLAEGRVREVQGVAEGAPVTHLNVNAAVQVTDS